MPAQCEFQIERHRDGAIEMVVDPVAVEEPLEIRLSHADLGPLPRTLSLTMRTPGNDAELAAGYLYSESVIQNGAQIASIAPCAGTDSAIRVHLIGPAPDLAPLQRLGTLNSSCGLCGKSSQDVLSTLVTARTVQGTGCIESAVLRTLPLSLRAAQPVFARTGGLHGVALFDRDGQLLAVREDVGRHNAFDKLVGHALLQQQLPWTDRVVLLSGRASFELLQKATMAGASIVAAVGAPSSLAIEQARRAGITLIGFLSGHGFNVYAGAERVPR